MGLHGRAHGDGWDRWASHGGSMGALTGMEQAHEAPRPMDRHEIALGLMEPDGLSSWTGPGRPEVCRGAAASPGAEGRPPWSARDEWVFDDHAGEAAGADRTGLEWVLSTHPCPVLPGREAVGESLVDCLAPQGDSSV